MPPILKKALEVQAGIAPTPIFAIRISDLNANESGGRGAPAVTYGIDGYNSTLTGDCSSTIGVNCGMSTGRNGVLCYAIGNGQADQTDLHEIPGALNCMHDQQAILYIDDAITYSMQRSNEYIENDKCATQSARQYKSATDLVIALDRAAYNQGQNAQFNPGIDDNGVSFSCIAKGPGAVCTKVDCRKKYMVRRLTPLECERLQGLPDGWTDIGAWTDSKGKLHKESSDAARYKAIGNGIALPPWTYVLSRLNTYCGEDHTMASLFDGIGSFPLIWQRLNGKGSCLWASEIEEFPIAVSSRRIVEAN